MTQLLTARPRDLLNNFSVRFVGEPGSGIGPFRELFGIISSELFGSRSMFFVPTPDGRHMTVASYQRCPAKEENIAYFEMAGRFAAMSLFYNLPLGVSLTSSLLKAALGRPMSFHDLSTYDISLYTGLLKLLESKVDPEVLCQNFTVLVEGERQGEFIEYPLKPGGKDILVTEQNKYEYAQLVADYRLNESAIFVRAFAKGFQTMIPLKRLSILSVQELHDLICGPVRLDVKSLQKYVRYDGYTKQTPVIQWFWKVVESMSEKEHRQLLTFWSGSPVPPLNGFDPNNSEDGDEWAIEKDDSGPDSLPHAATCSFILRLPPYRSEAELRQKLKIALELGAVGYTQS